MGFIIAPLVWFADSLLEGGSREPVSPSNSRNYVADTARHKHAVPGGLRPRGARPGNGRTVTPERYPAANWMFRLARAPGAYQSIVTPRTRRSWSSRRRDALDVLIREGFRAIGVRSRLNSSLKRSVPRCERALPVGYAQTVTGAQGRQEVISNGASFTRDRGFGADDDAGRGRRPGAGADDDRRLSVIDADLRRRVTRDVVLSIVLIVAGIILTPRARP
jgi:hypothetical protein